MMNRRVFLRTPNMAAVSVVAGGGLIGCMKRPVGAAVSSGMMVPEKLVLNRTGLGAQALFNDAE